MTERHEQVGFVGLGTMGTAMARHLLDNGWKLVLFDIDKTKLTPFECDANCVIADSPAETMHLCNRLGPHKRKTALVSETDAEAPVQPARPPLAQNRIGI